MKINSYQFKSLLLVLFVMFFFISCAPTDWTSHEYGFFGGIIHGAILPFSFTGFLLGKLFGFDMGIFAEHNTGFTYWLGFILGIGLLGGGATR